MADDGDAMLIERRADGWEITVPAKLNLFLEVVGRREDGYHELDTIMTAVNLCDRLRFTPNNSGQIELSISPLNEGGFEKLSSEDEAWAVPTDGSNLVVKALEAVRRRWKIQDGIGIHLNKGIPSQAGLGGGSADAAGAIVGGMLTWRGAYNSRDAKEIAASLGSDINFFLEGRTDDKEMMTWLARCSGRGEIVEPIKSCRRSHYVVLHPPQGCSTKRIFQGIAKELTSRSASWPSGDFFDEADKNSSSLVTGRLFNRLQQAASNENEWVARMLDELNRVPAVEKTCMTGSGSAVFGMVESEAEAQTLANRLSRTLKVRAYAVSSWNTPPIGDQLTACGI